MAGTCFPFSARLHRPSEFHHVFRAGERRSRGPITVVAAPNGCRAARLGLAVARRQIRLAVDRNRLKRIAREVFRVNRQTLAGFDLVITMRRGAQSLTHRDLMFCLGALFAQVPSSCDTL